MAPQITESTGSQPPFVDPPLLIRAPGAAGFVRANNAFRALVGYGDAELAAVPFLNWIEPSGLDMLRTAARMTGLAVERGRAEEALRKQRERELELEAQLRQAAKMEALGVLAGGVAHDFNNVLATILSNAELARKLVPGESGVASMLSDIVGASQRAGQFCQQMLAYAGRGSRTITKVEVGALFAELHGLVQAALSKKARIEYVMHPVPIYVEGDENQLLQVVMNLITNAAEALGDNEGSVVVRTELVQYDATALQRLDPQADLAAGEYLRLTVRDTGCGMDASTMARVFDPFFTTKFEGRGLGLSAVKGIVATHRGAIQLESRVGEGTTFMVVLPTVGRPNPAVPVTPLGDAPHARMRVLLVDDEAPLRTALARWLRHSGFEVVVAADGEQALALFAADPHAIDCVLLDLSMPKLSGQQVHAQLVAMRPDIPVVIMSGYSEQEVSDRFAGVRLAGTLAKPIAAETLVATLHAAIASTR